MPAPTFEQRWERAGLWPEYRDFDFDLLAEEVQEVIAEYISAGLRGPGRGLYIAGPTGTGKTALAHYVAGEAIKQEASVSLTTPVGYIDLFRKRMDALSLVRVKDEKAAEVYWQVENRITQLLTKIKVLVLDDLGKEHRTSGNWQISELKRLIRARGHRGLRTLITSNATEGDMVEIYGGETWSFLHQACIPIGLIGSDRRRSGTR
jgi:DNA replication protein DnaC